MTIGNYLFRKNPFPAVAHATRLGSEVGNLTVITAKFATALGQIKTRVESSDPVPLIVVGESGSGKTHFLKYLEHQYQSDPLYKKAVYIASSGKTFTQFVTNILEVLFDPEMAKFVLYRLIAFPVIDIYEKQLSEDESNEENEKLIMLLKDAPEKIFEYLETSNKSSIFEAAQDAVDSVSESSAFNIMFKEKLVALRDNKDVDFSDLQKQMLDQNLWKDIGNNDSDTGAILTLVSAFSLYDLIGIRVVILVDEAQLLLNNEEKSAKNELFRQCINATPGGSVFALAMRTSDWVDFRDPATERRTLYSKIEVSLKEAIEIVRKYALVKSGHKDMTESVAEEYFNDEIIERVWNPEERSIGKILSIFYKVVERVSLDNGRSTISEAVDFLLAEQISMPSEKPEEAPLELLDDAIESLKKSFPIIVREGYDGFDYAVFRQHEGRLSVVIAVLDARDDHDEANLAFKIVERFLEVIRHFGNVRMLVLQMGYKSSTVDKLLMRVADSVVDSQIHSASLLKGSIEFCLDKKIDYGVHDSIEQIEDVLNQLAFVVEDRKSENIRLQRIIEKNKKTKETKYSALIDYRSTYNVIIIAFMIMIFGSAIVWFFWNEYIQFQMQKIEMEKIDARAAPGAIIERPETAESIESRLSRAVKQLSEVDVSIRLLGVRSLGQIALTSKHDYGIQGILTSFVKRRWKQVLDGENNEEIDFSSRKITTPEDVLAALEILSKRETWGVPTGRPIDFSNSVLTGINLSYSKMPGALFIGANLYQANLTQSEFQGADFTDAYLHKANLSRSLFQAADFSNTFLDEARLVNADFTSTILIGTSFGRTVFYETIMIRTDLTIYTPVSKKYVDKAILEQKILVDKTTKLNPILREELERRSK